MLPTADGPCYLVVSDRKPWIQELLVSSFIVWVPIFILREEALGGRLPGEPENKGFPRWVLLTAGAGSGVSRRWGEATGNLSD